MTPLLALGAGPPGQEREGPSVAGTPGSESPSEEIILFTANQDFMSRIYLLRMDGSVITYFHYDPYRFVDMEVVGNELYAAEAFAPRVLKVDLHTGELDVIVDDWTLYYFYGIAFDGTHWYLDEWDLNRYEFDGTKVGMAPFDEEVMGAAWDGQFLWTLNHEENRIKCWDVSLWPVMIELTARGFAPPTPACRGLWFDGQYFWTAESVEGALGQIYKFDHSGAVAEQWLAPAFQGWGAAVVHGTPFRLNLQHDLLAWTTTLGAHSYDIVRGDLRTLGEEGGGLTDSVEQCLADNREETHLPYTQDPPPGEGHWYVLRGVSDAMNLTYDSGGPSQAGSRDGAINASIHSCP
jgi:hypothetical protein